MFIHQPLNNMTQWNPNDVAKTGMGQRCHTLSQSCLLSQTVAKCHQLLCFVAMCHNIFRPVPVPLSPLRIRWTTPNMFSEQPLQWPQGRSGKPRVNLRMQVDIPNLLCTRNLFSQNQTSTNRIQRQKGLGELKSPPHPKPIPDKHTQNRKRNKTSQTPKKAHSGRVWSWTAASSG